MENGKTSKPPMHENNKAKLYEDKKATHFVIKKDGPTKSRPWTADIVFNNGTRWLSWSYNYKTKKGLVEHCRYVKDTLPIVFE